MDWSKAKSILIVVLLLTNMMLIIVYGIQYQNQQEQDHKVFEYTLSILEKNNVYIDTVIPEKVEKVPVLNIAYDTFNSVMAEKVIETVPYLKEIERTEENYKKISSDFISECGLMTEYVEFSGINKEDGKVTVIYSCKYKDMQVIGSYMNCVFQNGKMIEFQRNWMEPQKEGETKLAITTPVTALLKFMTERDGQEQIRIEKMELTYKVDDSNVTDERVAYDTAFPTWRVVYNGGSAKYIQAFEL